MPPVKERKRVDDISKHRQSTGETVVRSSGGVDFADHPEKYVRWLSKRVNPSFVLRPTFSEAMPNGMKRLKRGLVVEFFNHKFTLPKSDPDFDFITWHLMLTDSYKHGDILPTNEMSPEQLREVDPSMLGPGAFKTSKHAKMRMAGVSDDKQVQRILELFGDDDKVRAMANENKELRERLAALEKIKPKAGQNAADSVTQALGKKDQVGGVDVPENLPPAEEHDETE